VSNGWERAKAETLQAQVEALSGPVPFESVEALRLRAFRDLADPLFFQWQRGEGTEQEWLDAVAAVRAEFPYVSDDGEA
jgi:hypothetical protein